MESSTERNEGQAGGGPARGHGALEQETQEVWCPGAESRVGGNVGSVVIGLAVLMMLVVVILVIVKVWQAAGWAVSVGGLVVGGCVVSVVMLVGVMVLVGVFSRVVVRMEGERLVVRKRPFGWKALWECEARKLIGVRVGVVLPSGVEGGEKSTYAVVVRLAGGQHVWLTESKSLEDVRSVAWEVGDFYGLEREMGLLTGVPVGRWWVPRNLVKGEPDFSGVIAESEEEVVKGAGKRGRVIMVTGKEMVVRAKRVWQEVSFWLLCAVSAGIFPLAWLLMGQSVEYLKHMMVFTALFFGCVVGPLWVAYFLSRSLKVVVNESGVRVHGWIWRPFYAAQRVKSVHVRYPEKVGDQMQRSLDNGGTAKFSVQLSLLDDPLRVVTLDDGHLLMEHALGVARLMETRLRGTGVAGEVSGEQTHPKPSSEGEGAKAEGETVQLFSGMWLGVGLLLIWAGLVSGMWFHNQHYPVVGGSAWRVTGFVVEVVVGVLWLVAGVMGVCERRWMEMGAEALRVERRWIFGKKREYEVERGTLCRAWVYRALPYRVGADGVKLKDRLVVEFTEPVGRCEVVKKIGWSGPSAVVLARAINRWLGAAESQELVREGAMVNGVVLGRNGDGEVVLPREVPAGWAGKEIGERRYAWEKVDGVLKARRVVRRMNLKRVAWQALCAFWAVAGLAICLMMVFGRDGRKDAGWTIGVGICIVWLVCDLMDWLMTRDWAEVSPEAVEVRRLRRLSYKSRTVRMEDVSEVCVTCEQSFRTFGKDRVEFAVNLRLKDGEYVKVAAGMESAEEAEEICGAMRGVVGR